MSTTATGAAGAGLRTRQRYLRYRDSGSDWLGEVPEHWDVLPTKHGSRIIMGQSPPADTYVDEPVERPFLQGNAEFGASGPTPKWYCDAAPKVVEAGTLLLSVRAPVGALNVADQPYGIGRGLCGVASHPDRLEQRFAWWTLHITRRALEPLAVGSTYDAVSAAEVGSLPLPLPPLDEQRAIAAYLDREAERIDALVAKKRLLIERLEEYRMALITRTVTRGLPPEAARAAGLDPSPRLKPSGVEWLGNVPAHWELRPLKRISPSVGVGVVVNPSTYVSTEGVPFLLGRDVREFAIDGDGAHRLPQEVSDGVLAKSRLERDDLVVVRVGSPGVAAVVGEDLDGANCASIMLIRRGANFVSEWLAYGFNSRLGRSQIEQVQYGAAQKLFNVGHAVDFVFLVPSLAEQRELVRFLEDARGRIERLRARVEAAIERLQEYRTALITAAVTGKIDVRE